MSKAELLSELRGLRDRLSERYEKLSAMRLEVDCQHEAAAYANKADELEGVIFDLSRTIKKHATAGDKTTAYFMQEIALWKNRALAAEQPKSCSEFAVEKARYMQQAALQVRKLAVENHTLKEDARRLYVQLEQLESGILFEHFSQAEARIYMLESVIEEQQSVVDQLCQSEV